MIERILIAGTGGQGIITIGRLLARAAIDTYPFVTFFPSYGAEVRGGTSYCQVILSTNEISSPLAERFDTALIMNQQAADRFVEYIEHKGLAIANSTICNLNDIDCNFVGIQATKIADQLGNVKAANLIMLGAMLTRKTVVSLSKMENMIITSFPGLTKSIIKVNLHAFYWGLSI